MRLAVLGGTGFVSGEFVRQATDQGHLVTIVTRGNRQVLGIPGTRHVRIDRDADCAIKSLVDELDESDVVVDFCCRGPEHARQAVELGRKSKKVVYISTDYVYDPTHRKLLQSEENAVYSVGDSVGARKRAAEIELIQRCIEYEVEYIIFRPPHIYGPGSQPGTIPDHGRDPELLRRICDQECLNLVERGLGLIQPIYVADFARLILDMLNRSVGSNNTFNCPGPDLMTHYAYYSTIADVLGKKLTISGYFPAPESFNPFPCGHRYYDGSKLKRVLPDFKYTEFRIGIEHWLTNMGYETGKA